VYSIHLAKTVILALPLVRLGAVRLRHGLSVDRGYVYCNEHQLDNSITDLIFTVEYHDL
jgi:hypothetical protein